MLVLLTANEAETERWERFMTKSNDKYFLSTGTGDYGVEVGH